MDTLRKNWVIVGAAAVLLWFAYVGPYLRFAEKKRKFKAEHPDELFPLGFSLLRPFSEGDPI